MISGIYGFPIPNWLNKDQAVKIAKQSAYRLLEEVPELLYWNGYTIHKGYLW